MSRPSPWGPARDSNAGVGTGDFDYHPDSVDNKLRPGFERGISDDRGPGSLNENDYRVPAEGGGSAPPARQLQPEPTRVEYPWQRGPGGRLAD